MAEQNDQTAPPARPLAAEKPETPDEALAVIRHLADRVRAQTETDVMSVPVPEPGAAFGIPESFRREFDELEGAFGEAVERVGEIANGHAAAVLEAQAAMVALWTRIAAKTGKIDMERFMYQTVRTEDGTPLVVVTGERPPLG